ncbi:uncharacterized protein MONBRDRAFT_36765 [Monosiga brevicollis MX1]|uniref:MRH domain-containing protein n=1 Tax=Monosiga brevicollis TaxID=81824 RepID=A9UXD8_MONBE|nr:uncharacterized protein MONBRDRAFT_36765 [Monosiga brevicollis MX1]EDQ90373.1 predicted protein [Monosiga brevicollis MX1]|eukprot:XP_001745140.1 hypothetical protein [Monosiga brevicollis MX1]
MAASSSLRVLHSLLLLAILVGSVQAGCDPLTLPDGSSVDITKLASDRDYYAVDTRESNKFEYEMNICQPLQRVRNGCTKNAAVCRLPLGQTTGTSIGPSDPAKTTFEWMDADHPEFGARLTYQGDDTTSEIRFTCGLGVGGPVYLETIAEDSMTVFVFDWKTDRLCINQTIPANETRCTVYDEKTDLSYDLSPLMRSLSNWQAIDAAEGNAYVYDINVCDPLVDSAAIGGNCGNEGEAMCRRTRQPDGSLTDPVALGRATRPTLSDDGTIYIITAFGDKPSSINDTAFCPDADDSTFASSRIEFICDINAGSGQPVLMEVSEDCVFTFHWRTVAACPIGDTVGHDCTVRDPVSGQVYDFHALSLPNSQPYVAYDDNYKFVLNVCAAIQGSVCGHNVAACQEERGANATGSFNLGAPSSVIEIVDDTPTLKYTAPTLGCGGRMNRTTIITFVCVKGLTNIGTLEYVAETSTCVYEFNMFTELACPETVDAIECLATNPITGEQVDLSALTRSNHNWEPVGSQSFFMNICADLIKDDATAACEAGAAVCRKQGTSYESFGKAVAPSYSEGIVTITFDALSDASPKTTRLVLHCNEDAGLGRPQLETVVRSDSYALMTWTSAYACPINSKKGEACSITDQATGTAFDFTSLKGSDLNFTNGKQCRTSNGHPVYITTVVDLICDPSATTSNGLTLFQNSGTLPDPCGYQFELRTPFACENANQNTEEECVALDPSGNQYDLTPLIRTTTNWLVPEIIDGEFTDNSFELNVCRGLVQELGEVCKSTSGACQRTSDDHFSLGNLSQPQYDSAAKSLFVEYTGGSSENCPTGVSRSARIDFACDLTAGLGRPHFLHEETTCRYIFQWVTSVACPRSQLNASCEVEDPSTGDLYDLAKLASNEGYKLQGVSNGETYDFVVGVCQPLDSSVCGSDRGDDVMACQLSKSNSDKFSLGVGPMGPQWVDNELLLYYSHGTPVEIEGTSYLRSAVIDFECDTTEDGTGSIVFDTETSHGLYKFTWSTIYACPFTAAAAECRALTHKNGKVLEYDLLPLLNNRRNYVVHADIDADGTLDEMQINVCRPLVTGSHQCTRDQAACHVGSTLSADENWGKVASPMATASSLEIHYETGANCTMNNNTDLTHSTLIVFECAMENGSPKSGVYGEPVYEYTDNSCTHHMRWVTSFACSVDNFKGNDCHVENVVTGDFFDFSSLKNKKFQATLNGGGAISVGVCSAADSCTTGACFRQGSATGALHDAGAISSIPELVDGVATFTLTGGEACNGGSRNWTTVLTMECDLAAQTGENQEGSLVVNSFDDTDCVISLTLFTTLACHEGESVDCFVEDPKTGATYDLSPLSNPKENWIAQDSRENNKYAYAINVCRTLVPMIDFPDCSDNMAACQIGSSGTTQFQEQNLGHAASPRFVNGSLVLEYEGGNAFSSGLARRTHIEFVCGSTLGEPIFLEEIANTYYFLWISSAACSTDGISPTLPAPDSGACRVQDPVTGEDYDLSAFMQRGPVIAKNDFDGKGTSYTYSVSICSNQVPCGNGVTSGVCQREDTADKRFYNLGFASDRPSVVRAGSESNLQLIYESDALCHEGTANEKNRSTVITFVCDQTADDSNSVPEFVEELNDCTYIFRWAAKAACDPAPSSTNCVVFDPQSGNQYDLGTLTRAAGDENWLAVDDRGSESYEYYINVCRNLIRPVDGDDGDTCRGAAICQVKRNSTDTVFALGRLESGPEFVDGALLVQYSMEGDTQNLCAGAVPRSTVIRFECGPGSLGAPVFEEELDCKYFFVWRTSAACPSTVVKGHDCEIDSFENGIGINLQSLRGKSVHFASKHGPLEVGVCQALSTSGSCANSGACLTNNGKQVNVGSANADLTWLDDQATLVYTAADAKCAGGSTSTVIVFVGDDGALGSGSASLDIDEECYRLVTWRTALASSSTCEKTCVAYDEATGNEYDFSTLGRYKDNSNWIAETADHEFDYVINVCRCLTPGVASNQCSGEAGVCQVKKDGSQIFNVGSPAEPVVRDGVVYLRYTNGDADGCPTSADGIQRHRSTLIEMVCDPTADDDTLPVFYNETKSACQYIFTWNTSRACPVKSVTSSNGIIKTDLGTLDFSTSSTASARYKFQPFSGTTCSDASSTPSGLCGKDAQGNWVSFGAVRPLVKYSPAAREVQLIFENGDVYKSGNTSVQRGAVVVAECGQRESIVCRESTCALNDPELYLTWTSPDACVEAPPSPPGPPSPPSPPGPPSGSTTASPASHGSGKKKNNTGAIVAAVIITIVAVAALVVVAFKKGWIGRKTVNYSVMASATTDDFEDSDFDDA